MSSSETFTTETVNNRNIKVLSNGQLAGWITLDTYLMGDPRWGFKDPTGALPETGWNYRTIAECLAAVGH